MKNPQTVWGPGDPKAPIRLYVNTAAKCIKIWCQKSVKKLTSEMQWTHISYF